MEFFIALLPILVLIVLIVGFKQSVVMSAGVALTTLVLAGFWWGMQIDTMAAASLRGLFIATEIILIVFSALLIVEVIKRQGLFRPIQKLFSQISPDYRIQAIIIAFALVYFIEGAAGFGTPAIVVVPVLMALGFKPVHAVALALIGDTIPVSFGAVGLPITFGVDSVIQGLTADASVVTDQVIKTVAYLNVLFSTLLAVVIAGVAVFLRKDTFANFLAVVPFAIVSGVIVSSIALITALFVGPELPSILGGLIGLFIVSFLAKHSLFAPKKVLALPHEDSAIGLQKEAPPQEMSSGRALWRSLYPYVLLISLLILTRVPFFRVGEALQAIALSTSQLLGADITYTIAPLYSAASLLLLSALLTLFLARSRIDSTLDSIKTVLRRTARPYAALFLVLAFVQIFIFSEVAGSNSAMPVVIAEVISSSAGMFWPFVVPFVGALGSFLAGSATVSNLIFSGFQYDIALALDLSPSLLLSLQTIGASSGNMIALHNIVAALAIAGISEKQSHRVIRSNIVPLLILLTTAGLLGLLLA